MLFIVIIFVNVPINSRNFLVSFHIGWIRSIKSMDESDWSDDLTELISSAGTDESIVLYQAHTHTPKFIQPFLWFIVYLFLTKPLNSTHTHLTVFFRDYPG